MKTEYFIYSIIFTVIVLTINQTVNAQSANSTIGQIIDEKYTKGGYYDPTTNTLYEDPQLFLYQFVLTMKVYPLL